jgi:ribosomal protein S18 acetylase RimI-like enzyme
MEENIAFVTNHLTVDSNALNALFADSWPEHRQRDFRPILRQSLSHICAYDSDRLIGFVNLAWDGGIHGFILDTTVHPDFRLRGIGRHLVCEAINIGREKGLIWLHVDYEDGLRDFYEECGFEPTNAGLLDTRD